MPVWRRGIGPEVFPEMIGAQDAELSDGIGVGWQPGGARTFESGMQDMLVARFDEAGTDG